VDTLKTSLDTKITIGDGGLFSQPLQNVVNSDLSNEYGSCESLRSVVNTPIGLFFISQAQGKIFHFNGQTLDPISNAGMKWWFNKYLPSQLVKQYPVLEDSPLSDNPVVGVGCQTIYDPNDDLVYFMKRDYRVKAEYIADVTYSEAGGFSLVAKSFDDARSRPVAPKFYLDKTEETVMARTEYKKLRNKALSELQKLFDKNSTKLFYIAKAVDINSTQYKKSTPNDVIYENMDNYINGLGGEGNKERAAKSFVETANLDMESLKIKSIVRDSVFFKYIINKADGYIYHTKSDSLLGRNVADVGEYLKNPLNEDILKDLNIAVEKYWNS
jgi:hypothetical protein